MRRLLFILTVMLLLSSCQSAQDRRDNIKDLKIEQQSLQNDVNRLRMTQQALQNNIKAFQSQATQARKEFMAYNQGRMPKYILKLQLRQIHYSLSLSKQIKDAVNAQEFEIPVDKEYFDKFKVGDNIQDNFRMGSLVMHGSFGRWRIKVVGKRIY